MDCNFQNLFTNKLIKMNYAIFCYREDYKCLELCVGQIRRVDPDCTIYLFDDGKAPLARKDIPRGRDIIYKKTYFERNRNLNGLECIRGMLSCMRDIPGREPIIKIDADTLLMSLEEIRKSLFERRKLAGGYQCAVPFAWSGVCYWVTRKFISDALDVLVTREFPTRNQDYPEDVTVSRLALYLYGRKGVDVIEFQGGKYLIGIRTCDSGQLSKLAKLARRVSAVHCGQQDFYEPIIQQSGCTIREACARIMWEILHPGEPEGFRL